MFSKNVTNYMKINLRIILIGLMASIVLITSYSCEPDLVDVDALQMRINLSSHSGGTTKFTYCYYIIDYDLPVALDNSIFFGTNF